MVDTAAMGWPDGLAGNGVGMSACSFEDAMRIVRSAVFGGHELPDDAPITEGVSLSDLDQDHVVSNCRPPCFREVWASIL